MLKPDDIRNGLGAIWYDYDRPLLSRPQILVKDGSSQYLTNWTAVLLGLIIPCAVIIILRIILMGQPHANEIPLEDRSLHQKIVYQLRKPGDEGNPFRAIMKIGAGINERVALPGPQNGNQQLPPGLWKSISRFLNAVYHATERMWNDPGLFFAVFLVIVLFASLFVLGAVLSVLSAKIANDCVVLSLAPSAGQWELDPTSAEFLLGGGALMSENRQARSWEYKRSCYDKDEPQTACNRFYKTRIPYHAFSNTTCPFDDKDACLYGNQSAYTVKTELLDSNVLGFNAPASERFYFQRTAACSPLVVNETYIKSTGNSSYNSQWLYNYGPFIGDVLDPFTYRTAREWSIFAAHLQDIQPYVLSPVFYDPFRQDSTFIPYPEFRSGNDTVTIMFISTGGVHLHRVERDDPVFPAHTMIPLYIGAGTQSNFWMNNSTRAGVLGCVDSYKVCADPQGVLCWDKANS